MTNNESTAAAPSDETNIVDQDWAEILDEQSASNALPGTGAAVTILNSCLAHAQEIDFHEAAGLTDGEKVRRSHVIVCIIRASRDLMTATGSDLVFMLGAFYLFVGTHWQKLSVAILRSFLVEAAIRFGVRQVDARYFRYVNDLEKQAHSTALVEQPERDPEKVFMNIINGTLRFVNGHWEFSSHDASELITHVLPHHYSEGATAPLFQSFLDRCVPVAQSQANLAEFMGSLFSSIKHEKAVLLLGDGHNGKSVFADVIAGVLGAENVTHQSIEALDSEYNRSGLAGYLLNYSSEIGRNAKAEIFKKIVSREPVEARLPYTKPFIVRDYARLAINANELPREVEHTAAFFRRLLIIPFTEVITKEERDPDLAKKIVAQEAAGVINWILSGLERLMAQGGFTPNPMSDEAVAEYRLESNSVAMFISERGYRPSLTETISLSDLRQDYTSYCHENGCVAAGSVTMAKRLRALGFKQKKKNRGVYIYAEIEPDPEEAGTQLPPIFERLRDPKKVAF
jgi:putative DNA primase/helicase